MTDPSAENPGELFLAVEKPSRYTGGEVNAVRKDPGACRLRFALAFPDTYEVGMSHLGLQILYAILNGLPEVACERCYAPWPDMERSCAAAGCPSAPWSRSGRSTPLTSSASPFSTNSPTRTFS